MAGAHGGSLEDTLSMHSASGEQVVCNKHVLLMLDALPANLPICQRHAGPSTSAP